MTDFLHDNQGRTIQTLAPDITADLMAGRIQANFVPPAFQLPQIRDLRRLGSCALDLCHIAEGMLDAYVEEGVNLWDHAAGGLIDIDFIAQYLQLVHAAAMPDILSVGTLQVIDNAARLGVLSSADADVLRSATRLYHDLTQILRLCVSDKFNPATAGEDLQRVLVRAGDAPDFSSLEARVKETQAEVRAVFNALLPSEG